MGVIIKIRNRLGFLLIGLIAMAIVAFLFMDISSEGSMIGGQQTSVGTVKGESISIQDFERRYQQTLDNYRANTGQQRIDEETMFALREETWRSFLEDIILGDEYRNLGVEVTTDEFIDMIQGSDPHPNIVQAFSDPQTGQYDPQQVIDLVQTLDQRDPTGDLRMQWLAFERSIRNSRQREKYNNLIRHGVYVPAWQANFEHQLKNENVNFQYIYLPYDQIDDDAVEVTDRAMRDYINRNKHEFKQSASRSIEYVTFPILPSTNDTAEARHWLLDRKTEFTVTEDDSTYLRLHSDTDFDYRYRTLDELTGIHTDTFFVMETGELIGPYQDRDKFVLAKLIDRKLIPDSVQARHILLTVQTQEQINSQRALADSILNELENGASFSALVAEYSEDELTSDRGGDWGWIKPGEKFTNINDALFYRKSQGDFFLAPSDEGFHVIEITRSRPSTEAVKVGYLSRTIRAGRETERSMFTKASSFAGQNRNLTDFRENATTTPRKADNIDKNDHFIPGIGVSREIIQWVNNARISEVSGAFSLQDQYVVVIVTEIRQEGVAPLEMVREKVHAAVLKEKKGEQLTKKIQDGLAGGQDLNAVSSSLGETIHSASGLNFHDNFITGVGAEPKVIMKALGAEVGSLVGPINGNRGVFLVQVISKEDAPQVTDLSSKKQQIKTAINNKVEFNLFDALKEASNVVDNRHRFY